MAIHEDQREANRAALQAFNTGVLLGMSTTIIGPLTTVVGYKAAVLALATHEDQQYALVRVNKGADWATVVGAYSDAGAGGGIAGADTVTGMRALSVGQDATITDTTQQGGILVGE
jgi:hypothetical protein